METETLWTLPLDLPAGQMHSAPRTISALPYDQLPIHHGSREEHFGIRIPESTHYYRTFSGAEFQRERLTTEPDGRGELITCWTRQK